MNDDATGNVVVCWLTNMVAPPGLIRILEEDEGIDRILVGRQGFLGVPHGTPARMLPSSPASAHIKANGRSH